jgi:hypothetical protein
MEKTFASSHPPTICCAQRPNEKRNPGSRIHRSDGANILPPSLLWRGQRQPLVSPNRSSEGSGRQQTPICCHNWNQGLWANISSCLRLALQMSLALSGLMSGASNISCSCSISSMMRSTSTPQYSQMACCTDANSSNIQFPIPIQRSPLHLLLIEQQIERAHDGFRSLAQLLCKVALADDHISGWELMVDSPSVNGNSLRQTAQFLLLLQFGAFSFRLFGCEYLDSRGGDAHDRC